MKLKDKVALVTGAGSGIGQAIALAYAREGAKVVVNDVEEKRATQTAADIQALGGQAFDVAADVSDSQQVKQMFAQAMQKYSTIDILVNNAGIVDTTDRINENFKKTLDQVMTTGASKISLEATRYMPDEVWDRLLRIHLNGTFYCTREALNIMEEKGWGKIINMASAAGIVGLASAPHYSAAKGAIIGFTKSVATEVIGAGVYVNAIAPGYVDTPLLDIVIPEMMAYIIMRTPLGRIGTPEEIASLAVYLASDESGYIVGQVISPNGGEVI